VRVGLVIYGSLETISGGYIYDRMLVDHLSRHGAQVEIISLPWRNYARHLGDNLSWPLWRRLRHAALDVLLQDELNHPSLFWLNRRLQKHVRYPRLAIVHHLRCHEAHPAWQNRIYRWVEQRYLATVDGFIFNSQTTRVAVEELVGGARPAIVSYPGGDRLRITMTPGQIAGRARQPGPLRVLFVGNLIRRKGLHTLLEGMAHLPGDSWRLDVVGSLETDSIYVDAIRRQIEDSGLTRQVTLCGSLPEADLVARLIQSHVLAVPSSYEGFGIVYLEGMGAGLPAIASTAGGAREIITHGQDGFLVPPGEPETLARHVSRLVQDREYLVQMSLAAQRRYLAHPTWADSTGRIGHFLETWAN
jgi:glycosyltransferase involved in cell wall biosynthesis